MNALIAKERYHFHERLFETNTLTLTKAGVASNADTSSRGSKAIAKRVVDILVEEQQHKINMVEKISGQTLGKQFEMLTMEFLQATFPNLQNLYPGKWSILQLGNNNKLKTSDFEQYEHLAYLNALTAENAQLAAALGNDYLVAPDVVVYRELFEDDEINQNQCIVDNDVSKMADIRKVNGGKPLLHASVSAKYTMRSDRAQNSRTEALNLIRNRKGHLPHIVVVTAEPMPNRLASLALGTGDIDCVYHFALYELIRAVKEVGSEDAIELLDTLVSGKRLKDINHLSYIDVNDSIRSLWRKTILKSVNDPNANFSTFLKKNEEIISAILSNNELNMYAKNTLPGGNLDGNSIKETFESHGIRVRTNSRNYRPDILIGIKENRNNLAHGSVSFVEAMREDSIDDIKTSEILVVGFLEELIETVSTYIEEQKYKTS